MTVRLWYKYDKKDDNNWKNEAKDVIIKMSEQFECLFFPVGNMWLI